MHEWLKYKTFAVVGASNNKEGYGFKISKALLEAGYNMIPISKKEVEILGVKTYPSLLDYQGQIDVAVFVVNPTIGLSIMDHVIEKNIKRVILQPGTSSDQIKEKASSSGVEAIDACVLVLLTWD